MSNIDIAHYGLWYVQGGRESGVWDWGVRRQRPGHKEEDVNDEGGVLQTEKQFREHSKKRGKVTNLEMKLR